MGEEYRVVSIVIAEYIINIFILFSFVFHYLNYTNVFHYYIEAILLDNLGDLLRDFDLYKVLIIVLMGIYLVSVLID